MERRILRKIREKSEECGGIRAIGLQSRREAQYRIGVRVTFAERGRG